METQNAEQAKQVSQSVKSDDKADVNLYTVTMISPGSKIRVNQENRAEIAGAEKPTDTRKTAADKSPAELQAERSRTRIDLSAKGYAAVMKAFHAARTDLKGVVEGVPAKYWGSRRKLKTADASLVNLLDTIKQTFDELMDITYGQVQDAILNTQEQGRRAVEAERQRADSFASALNKQEVEFKLKEKAQSAVVEHLSNMLKELAVGERY